MFDPRLRRRRLRLPATRWSYRLALGWFGLLMLVGLLAPWLATDLPFRATYRGRVYHPYAQPYDTIRLMTPDGRWRPAMTLAQVAWPEVVGAAAHYAPIPYGPDGSNDRWVPPGGLPRDLDLPPQETTRFRHWLGTDYLGHDVLAYLIYGARESLWLAVGAALLAWLLGALVGLVSGFLGNDGLRLRRGHLSLWMVGLGLAWFYGYEVWRVPGAGPEGSAYRWLGAGLASGILALVHWGGRWWLRRQPLRPVPVDRLISRVIEVLDSLPGLLLILALASLFAAPDTATLLLLIALVGWPGVARLVRGEVLREKQQPYCEAALALGVSPWRMLFYHLLPNVMPQFLFAIAFTAGSFLILEATLTYLGLSQESTSWGALLQEASQRPEVWWVLLPPLLLIATTVISLHTIGQWWQDRLDPRQP